MERQGVLALEYMKEQIRNCERSNIIQNMLIIDRYTQKKKHSSQIFHAVEWPNILRAEIPIERYTVTYTVGVACVAGSVVVATTAAAGKPLDEQ